MTGSNKSILLLLLLLHTRSVHKAKKIVRDATHPANHLFELLKSGKRYRSVKSKTTRFRKSFYLEAIRFMNG